MSIALVQEADAASSSLALSATTAGNTVVVAVACLGSTSATGVTGVTLGGSPDNFALVSPGPSARDTTSPNDYLNVSVWADANCVGGATALSVTGTGVLAVWAWEFSGLSGTADIAQVLPVSSYQDSWLASTAQSTVPAEAWVAVIAAANQAGTETITETGMDGWALQTAYGGTSGTYDWGALAAYQNVNTVGTPSFNGTFSQPSMSVTVIVTFGMAMPSAPAAAAAPGTPLTTPVSTSTAAAAAAAAAATFTTTAAPASTAGSTGNLTVHGSLAVQGATRSAGTVYQGGAPVGLTPTPVKYGNYTAKPGDFVPVDGGKGSQITITFPANAPNGSLVGVKLLQNRGAPVAVRLSGTDVFDNPLEPPGASTFNLVTTGASFIAQYAAPLGVWYVQSASNAQPAGTLPSAPAANSLLPADLGYISWSYDPACLNGTFAGTALTTGQLYLVMCPVRATVIIASFAAWITSAGSSLITGENFVGLYSATGTLQATSGDMTTAYGSTGLVTGSFSAAAVASPPFVWLAFLASAVTPPSLARTASQTAAFANGNLTASAPRFGTVSPPAGTYTSLPSNFSGQTQALAAAEFWAAVY